MRDIKFRAWDKVRKEYLSGGRVLISIEPGKRPKHSNIFLDILDLPDTYRNRFIIEQCTGLLDKNGKEIYEGDIVIAANGVIQGIVVYQAPSFIIKRTLNAKTWSEFILSSSENQFQTVVGNIYENPSLLDSVK